MPAVIFDLFGTLIDLKSDDEAHVELSKWLSEVHDGVFTWEEHYRRYKEIVSSDNNIKSVDAAWLALKELLQGNELRISKDELIKKHAELHAAKANLIDCAWEAVSRAKIEVGKVALVTDADRETAEAILSAVGLKYLFDAVITKDDVGKGKVSGLSFKKALKLINEDTNNAVVVGDSCNDVLGARKAGLKVILTNPELKCSEEPDAVVKDALSALEVVKSLIGIKRGFEGISCG